MHLIINYIFLLSMYLYKTYFILFKLRLVKYITLMTNIIPYKCKVA